MGFTAIDTTYNYVLIHYSKRDFWYILFIYIIKYK